jgi:AcrR family transcriptional regulator
MSVTAVDIVRLLKTDPPSQPIFPRLSSGPRKMEAEQVARNQRGRLQGAMVEAVARHGFHDTTLRELVGLAGVSKSTFYEHFENKQDCFLATLDYIALEVARRTDNAFDRPGDLRERMTAGVTTLLTVIAEEQGAASLVTVESLTLGAAAVPHRERSAAHFQELIRRVFEESGSQAVTEMTVRGIIAGIRNTAYHHLREGRGAELPAAAPGIVEWILCFDRPAGEIARSAAQAATRPAKRPPAAPEPDPDLLDKRERIACAATEQAFERGYEALSIPGIASAAGVSNQTFYDNFPGKQEAFLAGFDRIAQETMEMVAAAAAAEKPGPEAVGAGLRALLERAAEDELFARLAFFELPMAGPAGLDRADRTLGGFASLFGPQAAPEDSEAPPVMLKAISGGTWAVVQHEIAEGRREQLPQVAPEVVEFALAAFG